MVIGKRKTYSGDFALKKKKNDSPESCRIAAAKKTSIGGQALLEGIMMRGPKMSAMAVRNPDGEIILEKWETSTKKTPKILKMPIIRGVYGFISSMKAGYKALMRSAEISGLDELEEELAREKAEKKKAKQLKKKGIPEESPVIDESDETPPVADEPLNIAEGNEEATAEHVEEATAEPVEIPVEKADSKAKKEKKESSALTNTVMVISTVLGVVLAVGLFVMLPTFIYELLPFPTFESQALNSLIKSAFEGILKIAMLVGYMALVSLMKDIRRTFQYHGAEHKTIFCYESGMELTVENVRKQRRFHPRCGTAFLVLMLLVGMFVSFFIDPLFYLTMGSLPHVWVRALLKLITLPLVMGIGYELIKIAGRHDNLFTRIISAPGLLLQRLTVFEPDDDMIECAITAFKEVIPEDNSDNY